MENLNVHEEAVGTDAAHARRNIGIFEQMFRIGSYESPSPPVGESDQGALCSCEYLNGLLEKFTRHQEELDACLEKVAIVNSVDTDTESVWDRQEVERWSAVNTMTPSECRCDRKVYAELAMEVERMRAREKEVSQLKKMLADEHRLLNNRQLALTATIKGLNKGRDYAQRELDQSRRQTMKIFDYMGKEPAM